MKPLHSQLPYYLKLKAALNEGSSVYLSGMACVGKTTMAMSVLENERHVYTILDCNYFTNLPKLYIRILESLNDSLEVPEVRRKIPDSLLTGNDFAQLLNEYYQCVSKKIQGEKVYLILDQIDLLRESSMLESLIVLSRLEGLCLVLIASESPKQLFRAIADPAAREQLIDCLEYIYLPPFSLEETIELVLEDEPKKHQELYRRYAKYASSLLFPHNTKNLLEIKSFCQDSFENFLKFFDQEIDRFIINKQPNKSREKLMEDEVIQRNAVIDFFKSFKQVAHQVDAHSWHGTTLDTRTCYGTSILISAAFIAANTRPTADKINFVKFQKKGKRSLNHVNESASREFTIERLIHIFKSLTITLRKNEEDTRINRLEYADTVLSDIQLLENLNIIRVVNGNGIDSTSRLKISGNLPLHFYYRIAKQIGLELKEIHGLSGQVVSKHF